MSEGLAMPGLRGDDPLGFLAALGAVRLASLGLGVDARLRFAPGPVPVARLHLEASMDLDSFADALEDLARVVRADGGVLVGVPADFPPRKVGTGGGDPARLTPETAQVWGRAAAERMGHGEGDELGTWLAALVSRTQIDDKGRLRTTPYYAPSGQMTLAANFADPLEIVAKEAGHVRGAFTIWRRRKGFTGANLDHRALRDAGFSPTGEAANIGAPGPTWLALAGTAFARVGETDAGIPSVLWQRRQGRGGRSMAMVWPTWTPALDVEAISCLLEHPALQLDLAELRPDAKGRERRALGVSALYRSERVLLSNSDGPLGYAERVWPKESIR